MAGEERIAAKEQAQTTEKPPERTPDFPFTIDLRKAVLEDGEQVMKLTFREPTGKDIEQAGYPLLLDNEGRTVFDERRMTQMMATLAAVPPSSIRMMHSQDWARVAWFLYSFFLPGRTD
jgi:Phage tail assembly chaperone proteins, E, or 41 or 14